MTQRGRNPNLALGAAVMGYVVYVNHPTSTATVHDANCRYYRHRVADRRRNGHWQTGFANVEEAMTYAQSSGKRRVRACRVCLPGLRVGDPGQ